jgi:hypothetical protein
LSDARRLSATILDHYRILDDDDLLLFFSGSKGFHIGLPVSWGPAPSVNFHRVARRLAETLATAAGVTTLDVGVYDKVRLFRAPNSRHTKTGLHKRRLSHAELFGLTLERIQTLAVEPASFEVPTISEADPQAAADWRDAEATVSRESESKAQRRVAVANGAISLNRLTLDFIRKGAHQGDRHRLLFSAAANLAEFGCPLPLAHALLTEAALDCGLTPSETRRQIDCGLKHVAEPGATLPLTEPAACFASVVSVPNVDNVRKQLAALWRSSGPKRKQGG